MAHSRNWAEGRSLTYATLVLLGVIPIILLGVYSWRVAANATSELIQLANTTAAESMHVMLEREFDHRVKTLITLANNPDFANHVARHDDTAVRERLEVLIASNHDIVRAFVTDPDGNLWSDFPLAPESLGRNFSHRNWFQGLSKAWSPYVSDVYERHADPPITLVAIAAPVKQGNVVIGALVYQMTLDGIADVLESASPGYNGQVLLIDSAGTVAVHSAHADKSGSILSIDISANATGIYRDPDSGNDLLTTFAHTANNWTIVAQQSVTHAYAPVRSLVVRLTAAGGIGGTLLIVLLYIVVRRNRHISSLNSQLDQMNRELSDDVQARRRIYESLLDNLPGMVYECANDANWTMRFISSRSQSLTGYAPEELIDNRVIAYSDLVDPDDRESIWNEVQRAIARKQPFSFSYRIHTRDGEEKWVWEHGIPIFDDAGNVSSLEGYVQDISEQVSLRRQIEQSEKMDSLGSLAGGIAHDFNNVLAVILGYSGMLLEDLKDEELREDIQQIRDAATRASVLIQQLLAFCRSQKLSPKTLDINDVIRNLDNMLRRLIGEDIRLVTKLNANLGPIRFDPSQIEQIIVNLVVNARDAMPQGGQLLIQTDETELDEEYVRNHADAQIGPHIVISISDTGHGMSQEVRERIFEPFYTTKEPGKGTGLGLSTVFGIVKQSGGNIFVYSEPGQGTTFKVYLPRTGELTEEDEPGPEVAPRPVTSGRVLVVEDDEHLRNLVQRILARNGYTVVETDDPQEAIKLCEQESIDVLITDVVMPLMGGAALAERVKAINPDIRVVYMSGYTDDAIENHGILDPGRTYLEKPFTANQLLDTVEHAR